MPTDEEAPQTRRPGLVAWLVVSVPSPCGVEYSGVVVVGKPIEVKPVQAVRTPMGRVAASVKERVGGIGHAHSMGRTTFFWNPP
jgi:hypothetical protein